MQSRRHHRTDWPELGWLHPLRDDSHTADSYPESRHQEDCFYQISLSSGVCRWLAAPNTFEQALYHLPVWNLWLELEAFTHSAHTVHEAFPEFESLVKSETAKAFRQAPWKMPAYVACKAVEGAPLAHALLDAGFQPIEHRKLYYCSVKELARNNRPFTNSSISFQSIADLPERDVALYHEQILDICSETFDRQGHSRHFTDPVLLERHPGITYTLAVMRHNFESLPPNQILLALDQEAGQVCGFSVFGQKFGLEEQVYTQLLSAVRKRYQGQGIYGGLSDFLMQRLPAEARLLNVTHAENHAIQRAYQKSGRRHLADTVILRKMY